MVEYGEGPVLSMCLMKNSYWAMMRFMVRVVQRRMVGEARWAVECGQEVIRVQCSEMARPWRRARLGEGGGCCC